MKNSTKNRTKGALREIKGKAKKTAGKMVRSRRLAAEGRAEEIAGQIQRRVGKEQEYWEQED